MKRRFSLWLCAALLPVVLMAQELPSQRDILAQMQKVNNHFMQSVPDPGAPTFGGGKERTSNLWTRAVYYEGLMALIGICPEQRYVDYVTQWGDAHRWGPRGSLSTHNADNQCCEQVYLDMYELTQDPRMLTPTKLNIDACVADPQDHDWWWIDAIQMAMPVYAKMGRITGDERYWDKMWSLYTYTRNRHGDAGMFNAKDGLWWRDHDYDAPYTEPNGEDCYWSRGNGWVLAALVRVMNELPENHRYHKACLRDYRAMCSALKAVQREDGLWNVSLHDPTNYGGKEITGTSLFIYGMAWGIRNGYLKEKDFLPIVAKAWNAVIADAVHPDGFLGFVQGTGKDPSAGQPVTYDKVPDFEDYGTGCFLLAGSELFKLHADAVPDEQISRSLR